MRIIGGFARGRKLAEFEGSAIRPTADRIREALFSILFSRMGSPEGFQVLDLFAGTGALGIEALSRGAQKATFVERSPRAQTLIRENLRRCGLEARARLLAAEVSAILPRLNEKYDLIFLDPPYHKDLLPPALETIARRELAAPNATVCAETQKDEVLAGQFGSLCRFRTAVYGDTALHLFAVTPGN
ncbi:MAG: 16S rRNA (guanine(966)-N(2))-methyltransferase RsmD [Deltaproteobacteria bacterium]|nr:16S rRNA (guanine(966)-N(2))-methyltransferase RsmD [Deltaproteobacteria bacterium]